MIKTKKEIKEEYRTKKFKIGVFQIRNVVNGKVYIDGSIDLEAIWNRNRMELNFGNHRNDYLQKEWKEFGEDNFKYEVLSEIKQTEGENIDFKNEVKLLAQLYIDELKPFEDKGYNK
ncbi:MAG: GIY-YIG nuclease family protein [Chlorobiota bacterium]|nr:MAG: GIY-YIG nuclease family protein [Chlorobiota bacterium]